MITIDENTIGLWSVKLANDKDWLAAIRELIPDQKYELVYRFRYYRDDAVFESQDKKNWYRGTLTGTRNFVLQSFRQVFQALASASHSHHAYEVLNDGDARAFREKIFSLPNMFAKMLTSEEANNLEGAK